MKILNLYAGIGGNRKLWEDGEVTAVEYDERIAAIYQDNYPNDTVVVGDAHEYLLQHFDEFDFIWSSPPCQSHSRTNYFLKGRGVIRYPDMKLWQEIIFLQNFYKGLYAVENVISYYEPLIKPQEVARHYFWANFKISPIEIDMHVGRMCGKKSDIGVTQGELRNKRQSTLGYDLSKYSINKTMKEQILNNCVHPDLGDHVLRCAWGKKKNTGFIQPDLFTDAA